MDSTLFKMIFRFAVSSIVITAFCDLSFSDDALPKSPWTHESEVSLVDVSGNTSVQTYAGKQKTTYTVDTSKLAVTGSYLSGDSKQSDRTTGLVTEVKSTKWDWGMRYEFQVNEKFSVYLGVSSESDPNSGFVQRDSEDLGGKYMVFKDDDKNLQSELGLRYSKTYDGTTSSYATFARIYLEYNHQLNNQTSFKLWAEHLPNQSPVVQVKRLDSTFTTALVAKF